MNPPVADEAAPPAAIARFKSAALVGGDIILGVLMVGAGWLGASWGYSLTGCLSLFFYSRLFVWR